MNKKIIISSHKDFEDYRNNNEDPNLYQDCIFEYWSNMRDSSTDRICIYDCIFKKEKEEVENATIVNCTFEGNVKLTNCITHPDDLHPTCKLQFKKNVEFKKNFTILKQNKNIHFRAQIHGKDLFPNLIFKGKAFFKEIEFKDEFNLYLRDNDSGKIEFNKCKFNKKFKIRNFEYDENRDDINYNKQQQTKAKLNSLKIIDCTASENAYLRIGFLDVDEFELKNLRNPQNAELNIGDCHFKNFTLGNFSNIGKFKLFKINTVKKDNIDETQDNENFQIDNTFIGDADFQSVNLSSFNSVTMYDNDFTNLRYSNTFWPKVINVNTSNDIEKQQDLYRNLKIVAQNNGDHPQALGFYAKEMLSHTKLVEKYKDIYKYQDKVILRFNYYTNNFGLSWVKPLLILLGLIFFFYFWVTSILGMGFIHHFQHILDFANPVKYVDWIHGFYPKLVYSIFKIFEGLMLYQIIQAFRKYTRKL